MPVNKQSLEKYLPAAAVEEGMVSSAADLELITTNLRSGDKITFEVILLKRIESLTELASGQKEGIFSAECYKSQLETVKRIIGSISSILEE